MNRSENNSREKICRREYICSETDKSQKKKAEAKEKKQRNESWEKTTETTE